jgi:hypothetical protein
MSKPLSGYQAAVFPELTKQNWQDRFSGAFDVTAEANR